MIQQDSEPVQLYDTVQQTEYDPEIILTDKEGGIIELQRYVTNDEDTFIFKTIQSNGKEHYPARREFSKKTMIKFAMALVALATTDEELFL